MKSVLLKSIALTLTLLILAGCKSLEQAVKTVVQKPTISYQTLSIGSLANDSVQLKPVFSVTNNNAYSIPIDNFSYQLSFNGANMLNGSSGAIGKLPALGSKNVELSIPVNKEVFRSFRELLLNNKKLDYTIKGSAQIMGFQIPFEKSATFYRPSFSLGKIKVKQASFENLVLETSLQIDNPNNFSIPLKDINYSITSGAKNIFSGAIVEKNISTGSNKITIPIQIQPKALFSNMLSLLSNPNLPIAVKVDSPLISKTKQYNLNLKEFF